MPCGLLLLVINPCVQQPLAGGIKPLPRPQELNSCVVDDPHLSAMSMLCMNVQRKCKTGHFDAALYWG